MKATVDIGLNSPKAVMCSEIRTYAYLLSGAKSEVASSQQSDLTENEKLFKSINSILLTAFFFEAYLNHVGATKVRGWEILEKKLSPKEKLDLISLEIELKTDFSREPFQSFKPIFEIRNVLAHGKTENLQKSSESSVSIEDWGSLQSSWNKKCNPENAQRWLQNMESLAKTIHNAANLDLNNFYTFSMGFILERGNS
jgi:hypothetical protein